MPKQYSKEQMTTYMRERRSKLKKKSDVNPVNPSVVKIISIQNHEEKYYLLKQNKIHRTLMRSLLRKTSFLSWLKNYDEVMNELIILFQFIILFPVYNNNNEMKLIKNNINK